MKDERLVKLAEQCLVRVGTDLENAPGSSGSGVWIAPGIVLTCAHVVPDGVDTRADVKWAERIYSGTVVEHIPNEQQIPLWPSPDLALIAVHEVGDHPCAWLSEAPPGSELLAFGHSDPLNEGLLPASIKGDVGGIQKMGQGRYWQLKGNEVTEGMSGGPVLDTETGAVCGVMTATIGTDADRGGYIVPIESIRFLERRAETLAAHDRFHREDQRWTQLRSELDTRPEFVRAPLKPEEETQLLALLADLPLPSTPELLALLDETSASGRVIEQSPTALRDVAYVVLDEYGDSAGSVMPVMNLVHRLVGSDPTAGTARDLYDWATALAGRVGSSAELLALRKQDPSPKAKRGVVSVEIVPGATRTDRYRLTVGIEHGRQQRYPLHQTKDPVLTIDSVRKIVCEELRRALDLLSGNAEIEFVVPIELFAEPFDELAPLQEWTNLGLQYRVVLRDFERRLSRHRHHQWKQRWQQWLQPDRGVRWISCDESVTAAEFAAELELHPDIAGVLLARPPDSCPRTGEMLKVALDAGIPVAVWRRVPCVNHEASSEGAAECSGKRFQVILDPVMRTEESSELPESVRQLRIKSVGHDAQETDLECRGIVLLFDDPARATRPVAPVREPRYNPLEMAI